jgi:hypothetical protein
MMRSMLTRSSAATAPGVVGRNSQDRCSERRDRSIDGDSRPSAQCDAVRNVLHHLVRLSIRSSHDGTIRTIRVIRRLRRLRTSERFPSILISPTTTFSSDVQVNVSISNSKPSTGKATVLLNEGHRCGVFHHLRCGGTKKGGHHRAECHHDFIRSSKDYMILNAGSFQSFSRCI